MTPKRRILVVDDEKNIRLTLTQTLASEDIDLTTAVNGEEALGKIGEAEFDLVLLDMRLPGMDGLEVLRNVRKLKPQVPVIVLTAQGTVENAVEAMRLGAVNYLQKPFAPRELREAVASALATATDPSADEGGPE